MPLNHEQKQKVLECFLFSDCKAEKLTSFLNTLEVLHFSKSEVIYSPHHYKKALAFLLSGEVQVKNSSDVPLNMLKAGDCFGAADLFQPMQEYVSTLVGMTSGELVFIQDTDLIALFQADPVIAMNYISFLSCRIGFLSRKIKSFTAPSAEVKLAIYILDKCCDGCVAVPKGYAELARQLNIGRASLYRAFNLLEKKGLIEKHEKRIIVKETAGLERLSAQDNI